MAKDPILESVLKEIRRLAVDVLAKAVKDPVLAVAVSGLIRDAVDAAMRRLTGRSELSDKELLDWLRKAQEVTQ